MSFCFVHAADLHMDTPFEGIGRLSPAVQQALFDASLDAFDALVETTISCGAAFLLIAGDVYDGTSRDVRAQLRFRNGLQRLSDQGVSTFIVHGNHDPVDEGWTAVKAWPNHVHVLSDQEVQSIPIEVEGVRIATIHGMSYPTRHVTENLSVRYQRGPEPGIHIGLLHANVGSAQEHESYSPCSIADLERASMDYWALGHIHKCQILRRHDPWIVYSGSLQGRSPKPSEQGAKGAYLVRVEGVSIQEPEFLFLDRARFVDLKVDISQLPDVASLEQHLLSQTRELQAAHSNHGLLLRAVLSGRGSIHGHLANPSTVAGLLEVLQRETSQEHPFIWWDRLIINTQSEIDRDAIRRRGDFASDLLGLFDELRADPVALSAFAEEHLTELGKKPISDVRRIDHSVVEEIETSILQLLDDAETIVLDRIETTS